MSFWPGGNIEHSSSDFTRHSDSKASCTSSHAWLSSGWLFRLFWVGGYKYKLLEGFSACRMFVYICTCTYMHTYIHTNIHIYIYIYPKDPVAVFSTSSLVRTFRVACKSGLRKTVLGLKAA